MNYPKYGKHEDAVRFSGISIISVVVRERELAMDQLMRNYVNGQWRQAEATEILDVVDPGKQVVVAQVPLSGREDVVAAVLAAETAQKEWQLE